jgi:hypothetical protein
MKQGLAKLHQGSVEKKIKTIYIRRKDKHHRCGDDLNR